MYKTIKPTDTKWFRNFLCLCLNRTEFEGFATEVKVERFVKWSRGLPTHIAPRTYVMHLWGAQWTSRVPCSCTVVLLPRMCRKGSCPTMWGMPGVYWTARAEYLIYHFWLVDFDILMMSLVWLHNGTLQNGNVTKRYVLQNGTHYKTVRVTKRYALQNGTCYKTVTLQNGTC